MSNKELQYQQFVIAMKNRVANLEAELKTIDKEAQPQIYSHQLSAMQASSDLLFDMTGTRATEFKNLIAKP